MAISVLFTIFGATGDLASRKLYPSLFGLYKRGELAENFAVIGTARRPWTDEHYHEVVLEAIAEDITDDQQAREFSEHFYYQSHDVADAEHYSTLRQLGEKLSEKYHTAHNQVFFLAMAPQFFGTIASHLKSEKILTGEGFERIVIEKPFGRSLASAEELNASLTQVFREDQIFRIDHYLGKEMIQSIFAVRFANQLFESLWNHEHIDNVQITFAEDIGVEERGGYYEASGALRDMIQNHVLQVLSLIAMESPAVFDEAHIVAEKVKALKAVRQYKPEEVLANFVRGQYIESDFGGAHFAAYRQEPNVAADSSTETFVAGKFLIDNARWQGVPFFVRSGKRLTKKETRIDIVFKSGQTSLDKADLTSANVLTIYVQPTEGFSLTMNGKKVGQGFDIEPISLKYSYDSESMGSSPEAYEKLFLDVLHGDGTNFSHWEEAKRAWELVDVIQEAWENDAQGPDSYPAGSMGPQAVAKIFKDWCWQPEA